MVREETLKCTGEVDPIHPRTSMTGACVFGLGGVYAYKTKEAFESGDEPMMRWRRRSLRERYTGRDVKRN